MEGKNYKEQEMINKYLADVADVFISFKTTNNSEDQTDSINSYEYTRPMPHTADIYIANPISHFVTYILKKSNLC